MAFGKKKKETLKSQEVSMKEYLDAKQELEELQKQHGIEAKEGKVSSLITRFFNHKENKVKVKVNRKKYLWMTVLGGWFGLHRFVAKQYFLGLIYLLLFWTGFPIAMTIIDLLIIIPIPPDENGDILVL
jgi:TM2 domain-containing membrane protein YozV